MRTMKRILRKVGEWSILAAAVPLTALWAFIVVPLIVVGWLLYRVVTRAADKPCKDCGAVHETCPCCGWVCSTSDD